MFWKIEGIGWCWLPLGEIRSNFKHSDIFLIFYNKYVFFFKLKNITEKLLILHYQLKTDHAISLWERRRAEIEILITGK